MSSNLQGYRNKFTKVKTASGRKISSTNWLRRQINDPLVAKSKIDGYRSRAAYKLLEINDKFHILKPGMNVVDLGAAPGGWSQVAASIVKSDADGAKNKVIAIDLLEFESIPGVQNFVADFYDESTKKLILDIAIGKEANLDDVAQKQDSELQQKRLIDVVISDMAGNTTGHKPTDHLRIIDLCEHAAYFAIDILKPGGSFIAKIFRGGAENDLLNLVKQNFHKVKHFKPESSRKESSEFYLVALDKK